MNKTLILVVEDDRPIRNLIITTLKTHDYKYLAAENGSSALLEASSHHPDIVLLDLGLPDIDGVEIIKRIREWSNMPIIVISARSEDEDKIEALDAGADDYLTKPFAAKELLARIRTMIRTQTTQTESILHVGNITLNRATFELTSPTGSFRLANKEFQMMEMFLCNQGHSITHKRLLEKIWGDEKQVQTNVVWMYISYLRKKLEALHANLQITEASHAEYILEVGG